MAVRYRSTGLAREQPEQGCPWGGRAGSQGWAQRDSVLAHHSTAQSGRGWAGGCKRVHRQPQARPTLNQVQKPPREPRLGAPAAGDGAGDHQPHSGSGGDWQPPAELKGRSHTPGQKPQARLVRYGIQATQGQRRQRDFQGQEQASGVLRLHFKPLTPFSARSSAM